MSNYKIRILDEEFFMLMTDYEYQGVAMLAAMSKGAVSIELIEEKGGDDEYDHGNL